MEVILPNLLPWVKELGDSFGDGIDPSQIGPFVKVAVNTGEAEVRFMIRAAMLDRADVLDMECRKRRVLLKGLAIFATGPARSLTRVRVEAIMRRYRIGTF